MCDGVNKLKINHNINEYFFNCIFIEIIPTYVIKHNTQSLFKIFRN